MRNKIENENNTSKLGSILSVLIVVTVFSQFEGAAFEGAARVLMYGSWMAMFAIFCIKFKEISRTRYLILTGFAVMLLLIESFIANVVIDNYNPPLLVPFIITFLFYIMGLLLGANGFTDGDLKKTLIIYLAMCMLYGLFVWFTYFGNIRVWFETQINVYGQKNSMGQILGVGIIGALVFIDDTRVYLRIIKWALMLFMLFMILIIHCRTAMIALVVAVGIYLFKLSSKKQRKLIYIISLLIIVISLTNESIRSLISQALYIDKYTGYGDFTINAFTSNRFDWYIAAYEKYKASLLTVVFGLGQSYVDNLFLNVLTSSGVIGLLPVLVVYLYRMSVNLKNKETDRFATLLKTLTIFYIVESLAEGLPPFGPGSSSVIFWLVCGLYDIKCIRNRGQNDENFYAV